MDVPVAHVPAAGHQRAVALGHLGGGGQKGGDGGPGDDHVDDVVGPGRLGHEEGLLPGADQLSGGLGGQDVDLHGPQLDQQLGQAGHVLVEPVLVGVLQDDDQIGGGLVLHRLRGSRGRDRRWP